MERFLRTPGSREKQLFDLGLDNKLANLVLNDIIIFIYLFNWHCIILQAWPLGLIVPGEGPARGKKCSTPWWNCSLSKAGQGGRKEISK